MDALAPPPLGKSTGHGLLRDYSFAAINDYTQKKY